MSQGDRHRVSILWITFQLVSVLIGPHHKAMALFTPYVSEFEYTPESHPSRNPNCPRRWARGSWDERRSPDEGSPVGQEPSIEIRAVLVRCAKSQEEMHDVPMTGSAYNITAGRSQDILEFHGFDRDEPAHHSEVRNCRRKLIVTMKFNNLGKTRTQEEFVVVDHVLDPVTMRKARLLNPFVFKVRQEQVLQLYGLKFQSIVNGEAREEVINNKWSNYTGCDDSLVNPTCGQMMFDGKPMPYSQGFCCSCDPEVNAARQPVPKASHLALGTYQRMIPNPTERQTELSVGMVKVPDENLRDGWRNGQSLSKRERSLKSSQFQNGIDDDVDRHQKLGYNAEEDHDFREGRPYVIRSFDGDKTNGIRFQDDYSKVNDPAESSLGADLAEGKTVQQENLRAAPGARLRADARDGVSNDRETLDDDIIEELKQTGRGKFQHHRTLDDKYPGQVPTHQNSDFNSELVELEKEYERLKESRVKVDDRVAKGTNRPSKCRDFRKLARGDVKAVEDHVPVFSQMSETPNTNLTLGDGRPDVEGGEVGEGKRNQLSQEETLPGGEIVGKLQSAVLEPERNNSLENGTQSALSPNLLPGRDDARGVKLPHKIRTVFGNENATAITDHSLSTNYSNNTGPIILRQELADDNLYLPSQSEDNTSGKKDSSFESSVSKNSRSLKTSQERKNGESSDMRDRYADWVIKYAKMHNNHYINSQLEEPFKSDVDVNVYPGDHSDSELLGWPPDTLSEIANKALKEFESAENEAVSYREGVALDNSEMDGTLESLQSPNLESILAHDSEHGGHVFSSNVEVPSDVRRLKNFFRKSTYENSTDKPGSVKITTHSEDMVKGNYRYQDQSVTVIADPHYASERERIFLDESAAAKNEEESLKSLKNRRERVKSDVGNSSRLHSPVMETENADESMYEKFNRLDNLVQDRLTSRRRSFRSISYEDPFHQSNDERQSKIDQQIEKEFAEISEALNESLDGKKNDAKQSLLQRGDSGKDFMARDLNVMLNKIPNVDVLKSGAKITDHVLPLGAAGNGVEKLDRTESAGKGGHQSDRRRFRNHSRKIGSPEGGRLGSRRSSVTAQGTFDKVPRLREEDHQISNSPSLPNRRMAKTVRKVTDINKIVKEMMMRDDHGASPSWLRKQGYSGRRENDAGFKVHDQSSRLISSSKFSNKNHWHNTHVGKLQKKCHNSRSKALFDASEKDGEQSLPPEESTIATTRGTHDLSSSSTSKTESVESLGSNGKSNNVEGSLSPEDTTTVRVTSSSTSASAATTTTTISQKAEDTIIPDEGTIPSSTTSASSSLSSTSVGSIEESSSKLDSENFNGGAMNSEHLVIERSPIDSESEPVTEFDATTYVQFTDEDSQSERATDFTQVSQSEEDDKAVLEAENIELKKALEEVRKACSGRTTIGDEGRTDVMATTYSSDLSTDKENGDKSLTNNNEAATAFVGTKVNQEHESTTKVTAMTVYEPTTPNNDNEYTTAGNDLTMVDIEYDTDTDQSSTTYAGAVKPPPLYGPKSFSEILRHHGKPEGSVPSRKTGKASIILIKAYSVSQDPREFLNSYEIPGGVKKVLLKKLNVTAFAPDRRDVVLDKSLSRKIDVQGSDDDNPNLLEANVKKADNNFGTNYVIPYSDHKASEVKSLKDDEEDTKSVADILSLLKNHKTVQESKIDDSKPRLLGNTTFEYPNKIEGANKNTVTNLDPMINELKERRAGVARFTTTASPPLNDDAPHLGSKANNEAKNFHLDSVMEQPIFVHQNMQRELDALNDKASMYAEIDGKNDKQNSHDYDRNVNHGVVFFYDYDSDSDDVQAHPKAIKSQSVDQSRPKRNAGKRTGHRLGRKVVKLNDQVKRKRRRNVKTRHGTLRKREVKEYAKERGSAAMSQGSLGPGSESRAENISEKRPAEREEGSNGAQSPCRNGEDMVWQGKMDLLKLKKHQDILKEYLNWRPSVETTVMRIFSVQSTRRWSPTTESIFGKEQIPPQSSPTMSILLIEEDENGKPSEGQQTTLRNDLSQKETTTAEIRQDNNGEASTELETPAQHVTANTLDDKEILDKLSRMQPNDNLMVISVVEKNKSNDTSASPQLVGDQNRELDRMKRKTSGKKGHHMGSIGPYGKGNKVGRQRRNANVRRRKTKNGGGGGSNRHSGRRLMFADQLRENKEKGMSREKEEIVENDELLSEYKDFAPMAGDSSFDYLQDSSYQKHKRDKLKSNWDELVDKIIVNRNNNANERISRSSVKQVEEIPSGNKRTAMEKLHFFDADKYINMIAKKISRLNNIDDSERDLSDEENAQIVNTSGLRKRFLDNNSDTKIDVNLNRDFRDTKSHVDTDESAGFHEEEKNQSKNDDDGDDDDESSEYIEEQAVNDAYQNLESGANLLGFDKISALESSARKKAEPGDYDEDIEDIPYETQSSLVSNSPIGLNSFFDKLGSDFEISVSGKLHINGGLDDQPMSLSIEGMSLDNMTLDGNKKHANDSWLAPSSALTRMYPDGIAVNSDNKKDTFFGEAAAVVSPNARTAFHPKQDFIVGEKETTVSRDVPEVISDGMHPELSKAFYDDVSPRKTFYNVVVRAHPRYEKLPINDNRDPVDPNESSERLNDGSEDASSDLEKSSKNAAVDEPVFDFAKLELRPPQLAAKKYHLRRRHGQRLREQRATRESETGAAEKLNKYFSRDTSQLDKALQDVDGGNSSLSDIKLVKLIPVEFFDQNEEPDAILLKTKGPSETDGEIGRSNNISGLSELKKINNADQTDGNMKYNGKAKTDSDNLQPVKDVHDRSEVFEKKQSKAYKTFSEPKHITKITEPCFAKKEETVYMVDDPRNITDRILNDSAGPVDSGNGESTRTNVKGVPGKERLSTDDLHLPSWQHSDDIGRKNGSGDILLEGVKISSPSENGRHLPGEVRDAMTTVCNGKEGENCAGSPQDERKAIKLKNLMAMVSFIKKLENLLPGSNEDSLAVDKRPVPETLVQVQSILLVPENSTEVEVSEADQFEKRKTTERVVEIGEGVRHYGEQLPPAKRKTSDPVSKIFTRAQTALDNKYEDRSVGLEKSIAKDLADGIELQKKASRGNELITELSPQVYRLGNDRMDVSSLNNHHSSVRLKPREKDVEKSLKAHSNAVLNLMLKDRLEREDRALSSKVKSDNGKNRLHFVKNGSHETALGKKRKDDLRDMEESEELFHCDKGGSGVCNLLGKESPAELKRNERWVVSSDRRARRPVTYATGVSKMNAEKLASVTNGGGGEGVVKEKRRTQRLTGGKIVTKRKSKRHKHKKDKKKKKRKKNKKVEKSTDNVEPSKTKTKWWPFKRSLLNIVEDQQLPKDIGSHRPSKKLDRNSISRAETERQTKKGRSKRRKKRQLQAGGVQVRGGQDCMDRHHPARVNPVKYQESAHCLRFSDLWYSVYELENPIMEHTVYLQLFEKHTLPDGSTHWDDLTQGSMVRLGTFVRRQRDSAPTITFTYSGAKVAPVKEAHNLDPEKDRLLVPSPVPAEKLSKYPEAKGGSDEFLVVQSSVINKNGNECDKGGVGFATFATQPNRCGQPKGTCLKNQPLAYWRHDVEARDTGKPGCYFLSNFASVPSNPIKYNVSGTGSREYLGLEYHSLHVSAVDVEVRADYNAIVRVGSSGRVTEVHVDSTAPEHTVVTIVVSNMGLASSPYQPRISDCPTGLPISWSKAKGAMQVIPPQHDQRVTLDLYGQLDVNGFHCSVEVINHHGELVAMRRIRVQKMDRCFCVWHCLCACVGSVAGLGCQPMSTEHYHAAGFQGPVPVPSMESSVLANTIKDVLILSALLVLLLLILGMLKWFVGIFFPVVSRWGLDTLLEGGCKIEGYFEPELRCCSIVTDSEGRIVHPETGRRSVRICRRRTEFLLNLVLFLTWPVAVCHKRCRGSLAARRERCYSDESKICLLKEEGDGDSCCGRKLISVNTYGDCRNSKMEDEDTRYVMNELKRSRDSLQDGGKRCKSCRSLTISQDYSSRNSCLTEQSALEFVAQLLNIRVVFRNLKHPIGGLNVPVGTPYSLRGYFMNAENGGYRFITACPFKQHWLIDNGFNKKPLKPARTYPSNLFMRTFADAEEVLRSEEISLKPKGICLNVQFPDQE